VVKVLLNAEDFHSATSFVFEQVVDGQRLVTNNNAFDFIIDLAHQRNATDNLLNKLNIRYTLDFNAFSFFYLVSVYLNQFFKHPGNHTAT